MKRPRKDGQETRWRLLEAASEIFAVQGFWGASHAAICRKAGVNTASVNYHFGGKENLYVAAWEYSFQQATRAHPPDGGVPPGAPAEARLAGRIRSLLERTADPRTHDLDFMHKEMACPTGLLTSAIERATAPLRKGFDEVIRELLGKQATEQTVQFCHLNVHDMCFHPMLLRRLGPPGGGRAGGKKGPPMVEVESFAAHVTRFALAGIAAVRKDADRRQKILQ